nr:MAG TPA: hypothetical protein [Caudoviricetes sp.]
MSAELPTNRRPNEKSVVGLPSCGGCVVCCCGGWLVSCFGG